MLRPRVSPTLILSGSGNFNTRRFKKYKYLGDIINTIKLFNELEVDELTIYSPWDAINFELLKKVAREANMPLCYGGGVLKLENVKKLIDSGYEKVSLGRGAFDPEFVQSASNAVGAQSIVLTFDFRKSFLGKYAFFTDSGTSKTSFDLASLVTYVNQLNVGEVVFQSIDRDGSKSGFDIQFVRASKPFFNLPYKIGGGCADQECMIVLNREFPSISYAVSTFFTLHGKLDAPLISYSNPFIYET